ncbi:MAG: 5-bromo-4-chloroindolyl phosphate hydrolysis family protein [Bdellovibrio bacteriovorus]
MARARALAREAAAPVRSASPKAARPPRVWPLWVLSTPLLIGAVSALATGRFSGFLGDALGWGLIAGAAVLTRQGVTDQGTQRVRRFSRGWRLPLKNLAAAALGLGTAVVAIGGVGHEIPIGIAFGALAVLGYHLVYGLEPLRVGGRLAAGDKEARAVADALAEAEGRLINIERAAAAIGNLELRQRLTRIAGQGRGMLEQIAERPSDLRRARRFLTVFLEGTEQVSDGYVRTHHHAESPELEQSFRNVLVSIEDQFIRQRERLRQADVLDLDVQIEVLKKQLEQEGIH